ncbi:NADPH-cytochrome P450 reductase [[Actinomadura] parvosata subsp. kistnae]|uniref:Bifunctional cytochrome P450/NADPH--P450 reductase n=1 Tax=[Actinomadura] parvosata subsp. kistnae TaxID=1909395 RepID=A0A1V0A2P4_9ACTN|nr:cytochrome P450 [Nonomuraea sp. ATCC 55076]AQZ64475.1 cytochrome [Nonomuraea sp. ATCC 55076]SPL89282.1 NADPH-cytochrome P450 reductase [Actinomadura parvosata subsp. kistnae]
MARIPAPQGLPILGNTLQIPAQAPIEHFVKVASGYDEGIFQLEIAGRRVILVYDPDLVAEVCDESRFVKRIRPPLSIVRDFGGDGLFTADPDEPVWGHAHRILMPAFSQRSMKAYYPQFLEVAEQLVASWTARQGEDLPVADDMTRLTLDTISLTGFGYRFNSFDSPELHPFLQAMGGALTEAMHRNQQLPFVTKLKKKNEESYRRDVATMQALVDEVIKQRRADGGGGTKDLLGLMLEASDPQTGARLSDENIRNQVLTFLIAGHETTSGLLSFALYNLLREPHVLARAYDEVDRLLPGDEPPTYETIMKLDVIPRILEETLRIWSPIPAFSVTAERDTMLGGSYLIPKGQGVAVLLPSLHRSPKAWERPEEFDIDRWLPENKKGHHPAAYKPFGNGERACIGRQFALTEARLALALILRRFALSDPNVYRMKIKQTLTLKPDGFTLRVRERRAHERAVVAALPEQESEQQDIAVTGVPLTVAYGSNLGTSSDIAERLAERAGRAGFATTLTTLDDLTPPAEGLLIVVASSYNGKAPDNAQRFDALETLPDLSGVRLAVLGCGNTQWPTYQDFPRRAYEKLTAAGAVPLIERGEADTDGDFDGDVSAWTARLWAALAEEYSADAGAAGPRYEMEVLSEAEIRPAVVSERAFPLTVISNEELTGDPEGLWDFSVEAPRPGVRSIVARLPEGVTYSAGDHVAVFAKNDPELVEWALRCLRVPREQVVRLRAAGATHLPVDTPVTAGLLLTEFAELQEVATRADLEALAAHTACPWTKGQLAELTASYADEILAKRVSPLALLERFPAIELPLPVFLEMAGPIKPRYYSVSSSPLADPGTVRLTVGLVEGPAWSGTGTYQGMCSAYLAGLKEGEVFYGYVRVPAPPFRLPDDPATPVILVGPGTGFAPLRGFLEERALRGASGRAEVFTGCRHPEHDLLYAGELASWEAADGVRVHRAYSAVPGHPYRFVQDAVAAHADEVWELLEQGAHVYVCGDGLRMAPAVRQALLDMHRDRTGGEEDGAAWLAGLEAAGRYQQDVFA